MLVDARPEVGPPTPSFTERSWPVIAGVVTGLIALGLGMLELRWTVFLLLAIAVAVIALAVKDKRRLLTVSFILSFQADVYFRLMHGRAGSAGLAFPLAFVTGAALFAWLYLTNSLPRRQLRLFASMRNPMIALFATSCLSLLGTQERFIGVTQLLFELELWFIYFVAINAFKTREDVHCILTLFFVVLAMQTIVYYIQSILGVTFTLTGEVIYERGVVPRAGGTVSTNPAGFGSFIIPLLFIVVAFFITNDSSRDRRVMAALGVGGAMALILTFTRASWTAFALGSVAMAVLAFRRGLLRTRDLMILTCVGVVLIGAFSPLIAKRIADSPVNEAYDERAGLMRIAIRVIKDNPVLGIGNGAYGAVYKGYVQGSDRQWLATVHNEYLLRGAETGIPGMAAFIWFLCAATKRANRLSRSSDRTIATLGLGWTCGIIALCWEMYWDIWRGYTYNALMWMMIGLMELTLEHERARVEGATEQSE